MIWVRNVRAWPLPRKQKKTIESMANLIINRGTVSVHSLPGITIQTDAYTHIGLVRADKNMSQGKQNYTGVRRMGNGEKMGMSLSNSFPPPVKPVSPGKNGGPTTEAVQLGHLRTATQPFSLSSCNLLCNTSILVSP